MCLFSFLSSNFSYSASTPSDEVSSVSLPSSSRWGCCHLQYEKCKRVLQVIFAFLHKSAQNIYWSFPLLSSPTVTTHCVRSTVLFLAAKVEPPLAACYLMLENGSNQSARLHRGRYTSSGQVCTESNFLQSIVFFFSHPFTCPLPTHTNIPPLLLSPSNMSPVTSLTFCPVCVQSKCQFSRPEKSRHSNGPGICTIAPLPLCFLSYLALVCFSFVLKG